MTPASRILPEGAVLAFTVDLSKDKKALWGLQIAGALLTLLFTAAFGGWILLLRPELFGNGSVSFRFELWELLAILAALAGTIVLHELVHGVFFWFFTKARPFFGWRGLYAYAAAPGWYLQRRQYVMIGLAPLVLISAAGMLLAAILPAGVLTLLLICLITNAGGATGDLWIVARALRQPGTLLVEDLGDAVRIYNLNTPSQKV